MRESWLHAAEKSSRPVCVRRCAGISRTRTWVAQVRSGEYRKWIEKNYAGARSDTSGLESKQQ